MHQQRQNHVSSQHESCGLHLVETILTLSTTKKGNNTFSKDVIIKLVTCHTLWKQRHMFE